jgi:hypothetical protein
MVLTPGWRSPTGSTLMIPSRASALSASDSAALHSITMVGPERLKFLG